MDKKEQIRKALQEMAGKHGPLQTVLAEVVSVDEGEATCTLKDEDGLEIYDVRLKPVLTENESLIMIPKAGSWVLAARIEDDEEWLVIAAEAMDKYRITVGDSVIVMDADGFEIKKGQVSLKDILSSLVTEVIAIYAAKNVANLSQIKVKIETLFK